MKRRICIRRVDAGWLFHLAHEFDDGSAKAFDVVFPSWAGAIATARRLLDLDALIAERAAASREWFASRQAVPS